MPRTWTDQYTFLAGVVASEQLAFFVTHDDEVAAERTPYSSFLTWKGGEWVDGGTRQWPTVSIAQIPGDMVQLIALGDAGQIFIKGGGEEREELIVKGDEGPATRGPLRCIRAVAGQVYAVGSDRQVYRRKGPSRWEAYDLGARPEGSAPPPVEKKKPAEKDKQRAPRSKAPPAASAKRAASSSQVGFEAVDGFSATELYAVGLRGEVWAWDGQKWSQRDAGLSASDTLTQLRCIDGQCYAAGEKGLLVRGRGETWEKLPTGINDPITDLTVYAGALHVATTKGVYRHEGAKLVALALPKKDAPKTFGHLDATRDHLWSIGGKDIFTFDGKTWTRIE